MVGVTYSVSFWLDHKRMYVLVRICLCGFGHILYPHGLASMEDVSLSSDVLRPGLE